MRRAGFVVRARTNDASELRMAVVAPGSIGSSVVRNRIRRRVREAFRSALRAHAEPMGVDLLVTARREAADADFRALEADAAGTLREVGR